MSRVARRTLYLISNTVDFSRIAPRLAGGDVKVFCDSTIPPMRWGPFFSPISPS